MLKQQKGNNIFDKAGDLLTKSIGDDGVKSDIKITLAPDTYWKIGMSLVAAFLVIIIIYIMIRSNWAMPAKLN